MQQFHLQSFNNVVAKYTKAFDFINFNMLDHDSDVSIDYDYTNIIQCGFLIQKLRGEGEGAQGSK